MPLSKYFRFFFKINLSPAALVDSLYPPTLSYHRLGNCVPRPGQRWKPRSPRRLPFSSRRRRPPGRASGKPNRPSLLHAELLLHLLTLINSHPPPPPSCSTFHLRVAANGVCPSTCLWDHSPREKKKHPKCTS